MKKRLYSFLSILTLSIILTACGSDEQASSDVKEDAQKEVQSYTVTDDAGNEVKFDQVPEKIVSLQPSNTEILFELGVGDKIIGATEYDNYPKEAKKIERVSDSVVINTEAIIAMKPDAVIAYTIGDENALKPIKEAGIPVFVIKSATSIDDIYGDINQLAKVMGVEEKGKEIVNDIKEQINAVQEKTADIKKPAKVYYEISPSPDIFTTGSQTFQQEILEMAGVENIFAEQTGWVKISEEEVLKRNPQVILTTVNYVEDPIGEIKSRANWKSVEAIANNQVHQLDNDIMSRPGPRIGEAAELVAKAVYPELFE
ncbi:MAG: ABC transporter substrate-binding protein [Bacillus sp. (in: firmicutes)]